MRPLSARSVVLSLLLGSHPPELPVSAIVVAGELFDIAEPTLRVALTRMVANGDLERTDRTYRLNSRLAERQRRQDGRRVGRDLGNRCCYLDRPQRCRPGRTARHVDGTATGRAARRRLAPTIEPGQTVARLAC
jgi:hypothetical protein